MLFIFGIYVEADVTYDGSSTIYSIPIEGMEEYRSGMEPRGDVILAAGPDGYTENEFYTEEQYNEFWTYYNEKAGADFAQEIIDSGKALATLEKLIEVSNRPEVEA